MTGRARKTPAPARRRRSPQAQDDFRHRMLQHARSLFREGGVDALTIRAVTEPFGVSQMAFYGYFQSKDELVRHLWVDLLQEQFARMLEAGRERTSSLDVLRAHVTAYIAYWEERPDDYRRFMTMSPRIGERDPAELAAEPAYLQLLALHRERVLACAGDRRWDPQTLDRLSTLAYTKAIGYLHATIGIGRYPMADRDRMREWVIDDIVETVRQGAPS